MIVMYVASGPVAHFVAQHPTTKMLALAFLVMIGVALVADGFEFHIPRGYIYSSMGFAGAVELFNVLAGRNRVRKAARTRASGDAGAPSVNKVLLVTGASRGIGAAIASLAGARGYDVAVNYLRDEKAADDGRAGGARRPDGAPSRSRATWRARPTSRACSPPSTRSSGG